MIISWINRNIWSDCQILSSYCPPLGNYFLKNLFTILYLALINQLFTWYIVNLDCLANYSFLEWLGYGSLKFYNNHFWRIHVEATGILQFLPLLYDGSIGKSYFCFINWRYISFQFFSTISFIWLAFSYI